MVLPHVLIACFVVLAGQDAPASSPQSRPPEARPAAPAQSETISIGPDVISLERIAKALKRGELGELIIFPVGLPALPAPPSDVPIKRESVATFRVEIVGPKIPTWEEDLKAALAEPAGSMNAGYFDLFPGEHRAGAGPGPGVAGGGSAYVHPSALVDWLPRWARRRAGAKAKQQVEAELQALLAAQKKAAEKPDKEQP